MNPLRFPVWYINSDGFKEEIHFRLDRLPEENGGITLHAQTGEDFSRQILAEEQRRAKDGTVYWEVVSHMNHYLDALGIALAMGDDECLGGIRLLQRFRELSKKITESQKPAQSPRKPSESFKTSAPKRPGNSWMQRRQGWMRR